MNDFAGGILSQLRATDRRPITEWAAAGNVFLPSSTRSTEFREDTSPWIAEPLNSIPHNAFTSLCKPTQGSGTVAQEVFLAWLIANSPRSAHFMAQTDPDAEDIFRKKFLRTLRASPATAPILAAAGRNDITKNRLTLSTMDFAAHGQGINSMQSDSVEVLLLDEVWTYDDATIGEILERTSTVEATRKIVAVSQAGQEVYDKFGRPRLDSWGQWWHRGTQEEYHVRCPGCAAYYYPLTSHFFCADDARNPDTKEWNWERVRASTYHVTPCCEHRIENTPENRRNLSASGKYFATNPNPEPRHRSFRWSSWIVYWQDWGGLLDQFFRAQESLRAGDITALKIWTQKKEARWWTIKDQEVPVINTKESSGYRVENYTPEEDVNIPSIESETHRFGFADMQRDRFPVIIRAFANGSRLLFCEELKRIEEVEEVVKQYGLASRAFGLDVGNWKSDALEFCWKYKWTPIRGRDISNFTHTRGRKSTLKTPYQAVREYLTGKAIYKASESLKVWEFSNTYFKDLYSRLRAMPEHQIPDDAPQLYIESMESEAKDSKTGIWKQIGKRPNHYWDCEVGITFMASLYKLVGAPIDTPAE